MCYWFELVVSIYLRKNSVYFEGTNVLNVREPGVLINTSMPNETNVRCCCTVSFNYSYSKAKWERTGISSGTVCGTGTVTQQCGRYIFVPLDREGTLDRQKIILSVGPRIFSNVPTVVSSVFWRCWRGVPFLVAHQKSLVFHSILISQSPSLENNVNTYCTVWVV